MHGPDADRRRGPTDDEENPADYPEVRSEQ
jgi:hypothetical protein